MPRKSYHVIPALDGGWSVKKEGAHRATKKFETKESAIEWGRKISRSKETDLFIHRIDGRISDRVSYGKEPLPSKHW